jgi:uncharacterized protein YbjT (DUF2867 family)
MATLSYRFDKAIPKARAPVRRVVVFGASGDTGCFAVRHALSLGFHVTAFLRDPWLIPFEHPALRVIEGDVLQPMSLIGVLDGHEAVLCLLGTRPEGEDLRTRPRRPRAAVCAQGTANILAAMQTANVKRLIVLSAASVGDSRGTGRFGMRWVMRRVLANALDDKERQETLVRASATRWTLVRPVRFNHQPASGQVEVGEDLRWGFRTVSRDDVAEVIVRLIDDRSSIGKALTLA